jgi:hypothetical protein
MSSAKSLKMPSIPAVSSYRNAIGTWGLLAMYFFYSVTSFMGWLNNRMRWHQPFTATSTKSE